MTEPRLYLALTRNKRGTNLTVTDSRTGRELTLPWHLAPELLKDRVPKEAVRQLALVQRAWRPDAGYVTVWVESPQDIPEWLTEATSHYFANRARPGGGQVEFASPEQTTHGIGEEDEGVLRFDQLKRCTELGLHYWRKPPPHRRELICSFCSVSHERLRLDGSLAAPLIANVVNSHMWKGGNKDYYRGFQKPDLSPARLPLRFMVDVETVGRLPPEDRFEIEYLIATAESPILDLVTVPGARRLPGITRLELGTNTDANGEIHRHVILTDLAHPEYRDLGTAAELEALGRDLGEGEKGLWRALLLSAARVSSHALVTTDKVLLDRKPSSRDTKVLSPREALILAGIRLRYADRIRIALGPRVHLSIRANHFNQARPLAVVPELANFFGVLLDGIEQGRYPERTARLFRGCRSRLSRLAEAEDRLAFLWHFPQERSSADDDTWYHLEFLLMLAQALLDGLKVLAAEILDIPESRVISWRDFMEELAQRNPDLHSFLGSIPAKSVLQIVRALRRPLAHSDHWWGTSHVGGSEDPTLVSQLIPGEAAVQVPRAIVQLREEPEDWGITAHVFDLDEPEIQLRGYPFAVSLNVRLLWFTREFLQRIRLDSGLTPQKTASHMPHPWAMTNPPLDPPAHEVVRGMTWPLPD